MFVVLFISLFEILAQAFDGGPPAGHQWARTFTEDFDQDKIDPAKWKVFDNDTWGKILSVRYKENVSVKDGLLHLVTLHQKRGGKDWTTGFIQSRFTQTYGYWEARYRYGAATGLNQAFWLRTPGRTNDPRAFEIDINEGHFPDQLNMTLHEPGIRANSKTLSTHLNLSEEFHIYGLEWNERELLFYFDGQIVDRKPNTKAHGDAVILLSTAVVTWAGAVTDAMDRKSMDVDWVRVWKRRD